MYTIHLYEHRYIDVTKVPSLHNKIMILAQFKDIVPAVINSQLH